MLPVDTILDFIVGILSFKKVMILTGETGSGKTLRIPQLAYFLCFSGGGKILCTEPRRIAVCCAAKETSKRMKCRLGSIVGYSVRFEDCVSPETRIKFITEGLLIKEWLSDPCLKHYSILIIDEVHERSSNTDILLTLIRNQIILRYNLKIILMSATVDSEKFSRFLFNCPVFCIPGRCFSIVSFFSKVTSQNFVLNATKTIFKILGATSSGNILLFLKGKREIDKVGHILFSLKNYLTFDSEYELYPVFSELPTREQVKYLETFSRKRKIILATNIAEASITIPNINFVLDTGLSKSNYFDLKWNQEKLISIPINRLSASQRTGRTGRTQNGRCYRLYTKWNLKYELGKNFLPEIKRMDLCGTILFFKSLGIKHFISLNWLDNPPKMLLLVGLKTLYLLGAVNKKNELTILGRKLVELPLKPMLGKSLILSLKFNCKKEILYLSCMLSILISRVNVRNTKDLNYNQVSIQSDHMLYSELFREWKQSNYSYQWCKKKNLSFAELNLAKSIEFQLKSIFRRLGDVKLITNNVDVEKALISGFFLNIGKLEKNGFYRPIFSRYFPLLKMYPGSILENFPYRANIVLFDHLYFNLKVFMKVISSIKIFNLISLNSILA